MMTTKGRPRAVGDIYEFHFYYRFQPGLDPPELKQVLEAIKAAAGQKRRDIIRAALLSGAGEAQQAASVVESTLITGTVDDLFDVF